MLSGTFSASPVPLIARPHLTHPRCSLHPQLQCNISAPRSSSHQAGAPSAQAASCLATSREAVPHPLAVHPIPGRHWLLLRVGSAPRFAQLPRLPNSPLVICSSMIDQIRKYLFTNPNLFPRRIYGATSKESRVPRHNCMYLLPSMPT